MTSFKQGCELYAKKKLNGFPSINEPIYTGNNGDGGKGIIYVGEYVEYLLIKNGNKDPIIISPKELPERIALFKEAGEYRIVSELERIKKSIDFRRDICSTVEELEDLVDQFGEELGNPYMDEESEKELNTAMRELEKFINSV